MKSLSFSLFFSASQLLLYFVEGSIVKRFQPPGKQWLKGLLWLSLLPVLVLAEDSSEIQDVDALAEKARKAYIDRFIKFTQDKNVMGKAKDPSVKVIQGSKRRFNLDDGLSYESDLTFHDFSYNTADGQAKKNNPKDPKAQTRTLYGFISAHGGISEGGGSSLLERVTYEKHTQYSKQDEDPKQQQKTDQEKGIKYRSVFKVETREVFKNPTASEKKDSANSNPSNSSNNQKEPDKVERTSLRPDVEQAIEEVGDISSKTIIKAAKSPGSEDDPQAMGNLTFYYEAAARATRALWDSTLANLSQRRINRTVEKKPYEINGEIEFIAPSLSEETPTCEAWGQSVSAEIAKVSDANKKQDYQNQLQQQVQDCQKMSQVKWSAVDPRFQEQNSNLSNGNAQQAKTIKENGPDREDDKTRDMRNQLQVMDKTGVDLNNLQTNWKYDDAEFKNQITVGDEEGNDVLTEMTNAEQLNAYNQALDRAIEKMKEVQKSVPNYKFDEAAIQKKKIAIGETSILEINKVPEHLMEEFGTKAGNAAPAAQTYQELIQQQNPN